MNIIDLVIVGAVGLSVYNGWRRGALLLAFSWGAFLLGIVIGAIIAPPIVRAFHPKDPIAQAVIGLASFLGVAFILEALLAFFGMRIARKLTAVRAKEADKYAGALVAAMLALLLPWILSLPAKRTEPLAQPIRESAILRAMYATFSTPPDLFAAVGNFLSNTGFPEVFAQLNPGLAPGVDPPPAALANNGAIRAAAGLTFKIVSSGCNGNVSGSGFPARPDVVITAAHVVAGTDNTRVFVANDPTGYPGTVVYMDPDRDIAVLRVPTLANRTLTVGDDEAARGTDGAAIGYPGGGDRRISVARVRARTDALGYDIYSRRRVTRSIYVLHATVKQGNSGGPFVDTRGRVRGMVFAASAQDSDESYALTEEEIDRALSAAADRSRQVDTGQCAL